LGQAAVVKSTVLSLLERFYDPTDGKVLWEGKDISTIDITDHRKMISLVSQDPVLYSGTIRENVAIGISNKFVSDEAVWAACRQANIENYIMSMQ
jgi:ATP-binding cassette subfamily B (MDR/TAP) protein 1